MTKQIYEQEVVWEQATKQSVTLVETGYKKNHVSSGCTENEHPLNVVNLVVTLPTPYRQWQDLPPVVIDNEGKLPWTIYLFK